ncbi:RNA-binding protein [Halorhodospira halochloris]|uniref:Heat shock protein 15 n=1 Tax=Halorhodospira halochloris TaxID=1052 RepID=A0A0X8XBG7_HALHR|nr:S4 domain-containing protein [Halorhodospira halochloris]MBK1651846.1 RNA-binding protein [Halorhodospira halochloris]MCG5529965.1 RNA-binding protein [Halorhodospira halochloris]MCG5548238.1 RNA-binding protein [Halorhodospira halochloris]BAU58819.1 ribosome-associated heat shock protein [Halorhodospira halochloris]
MSDNSVRLDRWLWAARFFKTRRLAVEAVQGGKVDVDGARAKPGRPVKPGDRLTITKGEQRFEVVVQDVAQQRGPAKVAETLYEETAQSRERREQQAHQRRIAGAAMPRPEQRPDKRERRRLSSFKRGG